MQMFLRHVQYGWCSGDKDHAHWVLELFANIYQRPATKAEVAVLLYGDEGCGKGMIIEFLRTKVFGTHCTAQTAYVMLDVFD